MSVSCSGADAISKSKAAVDVFFEDFEAVYVDEKYFSKPDCYFTDDKEMNLNLTILKRFSDNAQGSLNMLGLSMGEYVLPSGLDIEMKFCEMIDEALVMGPILKMLGIESDNCPPVPVRNSDYLL
ncbi:hypothetical protein PV325_004095 [Microctonus aethiopoides]|nr:hypothetical protein PV325_004095 [Microctonus aethiopoides]